MSNEKQKVLLSGSAPSGNLTIGNYLGAIKNWVQLKDDYRCLFLIVDMHAITVRQDPKKLRARTYEMVSLYLACGLDPQSNLVFIQSHVPTHAELTWILNCYAYMGELGRMTQFKDKSEKQEHVSVGLFDYPVLMACDILLYQADLIPVGEDQKQHLELTRDLAIRFNNRYSPTFTVPEPFIPPSGARIKSLQNPLKKMSKSDDDPKGSLFLIDPPDVIRSKLKRAVTDSGTEIVYDENQKPALSNLLTIFSGVTGETIESLQARYRGKGYAPFKADLADAVIAYLRPIQERYREIRQDKTYLTRILSEGAAQAYRISQKTLAKVHRKIGFIPRGT